MFGGQALRLERRSHERLAGVGERVEEDVFLREQFQDGRFLRRIKLEPPPANQVGIDWNSRRLARNGSWGWPLAEHPFFSRFGIGIELTPANFSRLRHLSFLPPSRLRASLPSSPSVRSSRRHSVDLRLDSLGIEDYERFHGVCVPIVELYEHRFKAWVLGLQARAGAQISFTESRRHGSFHREA